MFIVFPCVLCVLCACTARPRYAPVGVRLDSGDLAYLSIECRKRMDECADELGCPSLKAAKVVASNDIQEEVRSRLSTSGTQSKEAVFLRYSVARRSPMQPS